MGGKIQNFYDLDAWKRGYELVLEIYKITEDLPKEETYGVTSQLRRVASSVMANIAEGFAWYSFKDKVRFYYQSRGSVAEVQNFRILAKDVGYMSLETWRTLGKKAEEVMWLTNGLIHSIESQK